MTEFLSELDIRNRALQHCGAKRVASTTEVSKENNETNFVYGKLRRAELSENVWTFATRRAILRPIDTNTMLLAPAAWVSSVTYFVGSIVADGNGNNWISRLPSNLGNDPTKTPLAWEPYFGPLAVPLYDSSTTYFAGEVVYTAPGNGTNNVYLSTISGNALDPSLPNEWAVGTTYFKNAVVRVFPAWASGTTYTQGQGVKYTDGNWYSSLVNGNVGNVPSSSPIQWVLIPTEVLATQAVPLVGTPLTPPTSSPVVEWASGTTYGLGAFVLFNGTEYVSLQASNTGNFPTAAGSTFWAALTLGVSYMSLIDLNYGNNPTSAPALWASGTTYSTGQQVGGSDGVIYTSVGNGNLGNNPVGDGGVHWTNTNVLNPWTTVFTQGGGNSQWVQIGGSAFPNGVGLAQFNVIYPLNAGPASQLTSKNIYRLPNGHLKTCSQDPKAGAVSFLGFTGGLAYKDWLFEGEFIVTHEIGPLLYRFVADVVDVTSFHTMFCEGLACRIALEVVKPLNQANVDVKLVADEYNKFMGRAKVANAIEAGAEEPPVDDYISTRY